MMQKMLNTLKQNFRLEQLAIGEFSKVKIKGINFLIERYHAVGLGNVSIMRASGFFGLMKMDTLIINPTECDMPLFSYDRVYALGNDTLIIELYNTFINENRMDLSKLQKVKEEYVTLPDHDLGNHWYDSIKLQESVSKKGKKKQTNSYDALTNKYFKSYIELAKNAPKCEENVKKDKASVYVEGLLSNGGPSTDIFKKHYGEEMTRYLFRKILFATE